MENVKRYLQNIRVLSLPNRLDRRTDISNTLAASSLRFEFFDAVAILDNPKLGCATSHYKVLKEFYDSAIDKNGYLTVIEDDCVLVENFTDKFNALDISAHVWDSFRLGGLHMKLPNYVSKGLHMATYVLDNHFTVFKTRAIPKYLDVIAGCMEENKALDITLAENIGHLSILTAHPNLAFQRDNYSDITQRTYSNYNEKGEQQYCKEIISTI
jgi:GR25 family glycosyltransferase involved in LPS biosynthesis